MPGHNGGPHGPLVPGHSGHWPTTSSARWTRWAGSTAHIVGNSLGGWVAFELERRGRARTLTAIAPAGGWRHYSPAKFEIVGKFLAGAPGSWLRQAALGRGSLDLPFSR